METIKITPQWLKEQRLASGLSQQRMAKKAGVTQAVISQLECKPNSSIERSIRVFAAYGLEVIPKDECAYKDNDKDTEISRLRSEVSYLEGKIDAYEWFLRKNGYIKED